MKKTGKKFKRTIVHGMARKFTFLFSRPGLIIIILIGLSCSAFAQKKRRANNNPDTLSMIREFVQVCNVYKTLPLQLHLNLRNSTNFITDQQDTASYEAEFYLLNGTSYVRFGEVEQFVNDSLALLVSNKIQKMILSADVEPVLLQMKASLGIQMSDSSILELSKKFKAGKKENNADTMGIELTSRNLLYGTNLPMESLEIRFNSKTKNPSQVLTTKRSLIFLDQEEYENLKTKPKMASRIVMIEDKNYLIKEQVAEYKYRSISHDILMMPVSVNERIVKGVQGEYIPVKGYDSYQLILN